MSASTANMAASFLDVSRSTIGMSPSNVFMNPSMHITTMHIENMVHTTRDLTGTEDADENPLNADGSAPTPREKALDLLVNTTVTMVFNPATNKYELLTTRHAPSMWWLERSMREIEQQCEDGVDDAMDNLSQAVAIQAELAAVQHDHEALGALLEQHEREAAREMLDIQAEEQQDRAIEELLENMEPEEIEELTDEL
jgi:hypothetical protein